MEKDSLRSTNSRCDMRLAALQLNAKIKRNRRWKDAVISACIDNHRIGNPPLENKRIQRDGNYRPLDGAKDGCRTSFVGKGDWVGFHSARISVSALGT
jgi:hypothetical protein